VAHADDVEVIHDQSGVGQLVGSGGGVGLVRIDDHVVDPGQRAGLDASDARTAVALRAGSTSTSRLRSRSRIPVMSSVGCRVAARKEVSATPIAPGAPSLAW
jgi:hypothetical protein